MRLNLSYTLFIALVSCIAIINCCTDNEGFPDFEDCSCSSLSNNIICGSDGRSYLDSCFALCVEINIVQAGNCPGATTNDSDTLRWPIQSVCIPLATNDDPQPVYTLVDGSVIYQNPDGSFFRGTPNFCRCLPGETLIATPEGHKAINRLKVEDQILTISKSREKIINSIVLIRKVPIPDNYKMLQLTLDDGRQLVVSPQHPDATGTQIYKLEIGDCLDGSQLKDKKLINYQSQFTWDLLPAGDYPVYFANGILLGSTLKSTPPTL